jgi:hypothetical protein
MGHRRCALGPLHHVPSQRVHVAVFVQRTCVARCLCVSTAGLGFERDGVWALAVLRGHRAKTGMLLCT